MEAAKGTSTRTSDVLAAGPLIPAIGVLLWWAGGEAGYPASHWLPGGLVLLGLLVALVGAQWGALPRLPGAAGVALAALALFTLWSYASVAWADAPGSAFQGANRTLVYLVAFALFAAAAQTARSAGTLLALWTLGMATLAVVTVLRLTTMADPGELFISSRLAEPAGYTNAAAATWLMALWPAVALAARPAVPWPVRGLLAGGAVVLVDLALLSQSRGSFITLAITAPLFFLLVPGRVRAWATLVPIAGAVALTAPEVLDVRDALEAGGAAPAVLDGALRPVPWAALAVALVVAVAGGLERWRPPSARTERVAHRTVGAVAAALTAFGVAVVLAVTWSPADRLDDGWASFKRGYTDTERSGTRLSQGLGSNRYDFYRVALDRFRAEPVAGIGVDNFYEPYLAERRSAEQPLYPHSLELRTLSQTGIVGSALLLVALGAGLFAALAAARRAAGGWVAAAAAMPFVYWFVHGSADWFWEMPGLATPALAFLGLGAALAPRAERPARTRRLPAAVAPVAAGLAAAAAALVLGASWVATRDVDEAARKWPADPAAAYRRLDRAAALDPFSPRPYLVGGVIALRRDDLERARQQFERALDRSPDSHYATLEVAAIESSQGRRARARRLFDRAQRLNPGDRLTRESAARARRGQRIDVHELNRRIGHAARDFL